ncbi:hypothetical protein CRG98_021846, partial [Punica granatum]
MDSLALHSLSALLLLLITSASAAASDPTNQFCDARIGYGDSGCGVSAAASSSKILIKGGTVVNAHHQEIADVFVEHGIIVDVKPNIK